jgi:hypothetical protein
MFVVAAGFQLRRPLRGMSHLSCRTVRRTSMASASPKRPHRIRPAASRMQDINHDRLGSDGGDGLSDSDSGSGSGSGSGSDSDAADGSGVDDDDDDEQVQDDENQDEEGFDEDQDDEELDNANDNEAEDEDDDDEESSARSSGEDARSVAAAADAIDEATRAAQERPFESLQELASYLNADTESFVVTGALVLIAAVRAVAVLPCFRASRAQCFSEFVGIFSNSRWSFECVTLHRYLPFVAQV